MRKVLDLDMVFWYIDMNMGHVRSFWNKNVILNLNRMIGREFVGLIVGQKSANKLI